MLTCIIVDDEPKARSSLAILIGLYCPDLIVLAQCSKLSHAVEQIKQHKPEIVFLDVQMPAQNGIELYQYFPEPDFKVIFTTAYTDYALQAIKKHASDYLLKPILPDELKQAVQKAGSELKNEHDLLRLQKSENGDQILPTDLDFAKQTFNLSNREMQVLRCLVAGDSYKMIAEKCFISMGTVFTHIANLYRKMSVNSKAEAVAKALQNNIFKKI